jgi:hypothetical protein
MAQPDGPERGNCIPFVNVEPLDIGPILAAAQHLLDQCALYQEVVAGPCRESPIAWNLVGDVRLAATALLDTLHASGLTEGPLCGSPGKVDGIDVVRLGVRGLIDGIEKSPYAVTTFNEGVPSVCLRFPPGEVFPFDAKAIGEIRFGVRRLQALPSCPCRNEDQLDDTTPEAEPHPEDGHDDGSGERHWRRGPFGLLLDDKAHVAQRGNEEVDFRGHEKAWVVFLRLCARGNAYYPAGDLGHDVWNPDKRDSDPEPAAVQVQVTYARKLLLALGLNIKHTRSLGYRIEEQKPGKTGKRRHRRRRP